MLLWLQASPSGASAPDLHILTPSAHAADSRRYTQRSPSCSTIPATVQQHIPHVLGRYCMRCSY